MTIMKNSFMDRNTYWRIIIPGLLMACNLAFAQRAMPEGIQPFGGSLVIRYVPTHKSQCVARIYEKNKGNLFGSRKTSNIDYEVFRGQAGDLKYSTTLSGSFADGLSSSDYIRLIYSIMDSGGLDVENPIFQTNINFPQDQLMMLKNTLGKLGLQYSWLINQPLRYGQVLQSPDLCNAFGKSFNLDLKTLKREGGVRVVGTGLMLGRENIFFSHDESISCGIDSFRIELKNSGWGALDIKSGHLGGSSKMGTLVFQGDLNTSEDDYTCKVSGVLAESNNTSADKGIIEQRLKELKSLFERNLISKEIYEQKTLDILKAL